MAAAPPAPEPPEGKAASLAARLEGRRRRIAQLALEGKEIATGHNGGRYPKDWPPEMRHRTPKLTTLQQIEALSATWAAERQMLKKELACAASSSASSTAALTQTSAR